MFSKIKDFLFIYIIILIFIIAGIALIVINNDFLFGTIFLVGGLALLTLPIIVNIQKKSNEIYNQNTEFNNELENLFNNKE